jgi:hypothetical protein
MPGPAGWVLNLGGAHGTPGVATPENVLEVLPAGGQRSSNPARSSSRVREAVKRFESFHGRPARKSQRVEVPTFGGVLVSLGRPVAVEYEATKHGERRAIYRHKFGPGVRIATDPKGKAILIWGGRLRVTDWLYN